MPPGAVVLGTSNSVVDEAPEPWVPEGAVEPDVADGPLVEPVDPGAGVLRPLDVADPLFEFEAPDGPVPIGTLLELVPVGETGPV